MIGVVAVVTLVGTCTVKIVKTICEHRAEIITARSEAETARIRAQTRARLLAEGASEMLLLEPMSADLPKDRRLDDNHLVKGLLACIAKIRGGTRPSGDPPDPRDAGPGGGVVPLRRNDSRGGGISALRHRDRAGPLMASGLP